MSLREKTVKVFYELKNTLVVREEMLERDFDLNEINELIVDKAKALIEDFEVFCEEETANNTAPSRPPTKKSEMPCNCKQETITPATINTKFFS